MRTQSQWKLVEKDELLRSGDSLLDLGISSHPCDCDREALDHALHRLARIDPLATRPDHPQVQLHHCTTRAKDILGDLMGPSSMHVKLRSKAMREGSSKVTTGLLSCALIVLTIVVPGGRSRSGSGTLHGVTLRAWWSFYRATVNTLFGGQPP